MRALRGPVGLLAGLALALAACGPAPPDRPAAPAATPPPSAAPVPPAVSPTIVPARPLAKPGPLAAAPAPPTLTAERGLPRRYDAIIRRSVARYACAPLAEQWWAQIMTESAMKPDAVSPVGARGAAQIMPATFAEIARKIDLGVADPFDFQTSSDAGCFYMAERRRVWKSPRPEQDRHDLAASGYNAGDGNILKAQKRCAAAGPDGRPVLPVLYAEIIACLPEITGHHATETINYVKRIKYWTERKLAGG